MPNGSCEAPVPEHIRWHNKQTVHSIILDHSFYFCKKNAVFVNRLAKADIADSQHWQAGSGYEWTVRTLPSNPLSSNCFLEPEILPQSPPQRLYFGDDVAQFFLSCIFRLEAGSMGSSPNLHTRQPHQFLDGEIRRAVRVAAHFCTGCFSLFNSLKSMRYAPFIRKAHP